MEDPGKGGHLRWRRERPDRYASICRLKPCYVSGHKTINLRWGGTSRRWHYQLVSEDPSDHRGGNFGGRVCGHVGEYEGGTASPSGIDLYHACPREQTRRHHEGPPRGLQEGQQQTFKQANEAHRHQKSPHPKKGFASLTSKSRSTIGGGAGMSNFNPVLGGDSTKVAPPGDLFDQPPGEMS